MFQRNCCQGKTDERTSQEVRLFPEIICAVAVVLPVPSCISRYQKECPTPLGPSERQSRPISENDGRGNLILVQGQAHGIIEIIFARDGGQAKKSVRAFYCFDFASVDSYYCFLEPVRRINILRTIHRSGVLFSTEGIDRHLLPMARGE